jgi:Protein kinase domain
MGPSEILPPGSVLGAYELLDVLGSGGYGVVYRACHRVLGRAVAIKVLHAERSADPRAVRSFIEEARAVNLLRVPGTVEIFDCGSSDGRYYLVMELLQGRSLATLLGERGALPLDEAQPLLRDIAKIVDALHAEGACHRDLKPANVMVDGDRVTLIDFGLVKLVGDIDRTQTRDALGTPLYMSPEQCRGVPATAASDRYAFGVLAYQLLTGLPPFVGDGVALAVAHIEATPRRPSRVKRGLAPSADVILSLLAKQPAKRPRALTPVVYQLRLRSHRRPIAIAAITSMLAIAASVAYVFTRPSPARPIAAERVHISRTQRAWMWNMPSIAPDGRFVFYTGPRGLNTVHWEGAENTEGTEREYVSRFPDGRSVESREDVQIVGSTGTTSIGSGKFAEACGDNHSVAVFGNDKIVVYDTRTRTARDVANAPGVLGGRWSPSCKQLVWGDSAGARLTDIATAATLALPIELAGPATTHAPAAFFDDNTIIYCGRGPDGVTATLRAHYLDNRAPDISLAPLPTLAGCSIAAAHDGHRLVVTTTEVSDQLIVVDTTKTPPTRSPLAERFQSPTRALAFSDKDHVLTASFTFATDSPVQRFESVGFDRTRVVEQPCRGMLAITRFDGSLAAVTRDPDGFVLRDLRTCARRTRLPLTSSAAWAIPSCAGTRCFSATIDGDDIDLYELGSPTTKLARVARASSAQDGNLIVRISPDATHAIMFRESALFYQLITIADGTTRQIAAGVSAASSIRQAEWADASSYYLSHEEQSGNFVERVDLDGHHTIYDRDLMRLDAVSPDGTKFITSTGEDVRNILFVEIDR